MAVSCAGAGFALAAAGVAVVFLKFANGLGFGFAGAAFLLAGPLLALGLLGATVSFGGSGTLGFAALVDGAAAAGRASTGGLRTVRL